MILADPLQALDQLDELLSQVNLNRESTLHVIDCVATIRQALIAVEAVPERTQNGSKEPADA